MAECDVARERMPALLVEALGRDDRESTHHHIESCAECAAEWAETREVWTLLEAIPDRPVPAGLKDRVLESVGARPETAKVVPFRHREWTRWVAQAAAVVILVGSSFVAGRMGSDSEAAEPAQVAAQPFRLAGSQVIPASQLGEIEGSPRIGNVRFLSQQGDQVRVAFDLTSEITVTGSAEDESLGNLVAYMLESRNDTMQSRSNAIQFIRDSFPASGKASPDLARALGNVLRNDQHEGVRLKAIEALKTLPPETASLTQQALVEALQNDPNPAVRLKAVEVLANFATAGTPLDPAMVDTLRRKASQDDENLYVRVKAAEALSQIDL